MIELKRLSLVVALLIIAGVPALAIDVAIPSDMYGYTWTGTPGDVAPGAIITAPWSSSWGTGAGRGYGMAFDENGDLIRYIAGEHNHQLSAWDFQEDYENRHLYPIDYVSYPEGIVVLDSNFVSIDTIPGINPFDPGLQIDMHETFYDENGNFWAEWSEYRIIDMTQWDPDGNPECEVHGNVIQQWDPDGNLIWEWRGMDYIDELPPDQHVNGDDLSGDTFNHLHVNAFELTDEGDVLISARFLSCIIKVDYDTGNIEWLMGAGPLNEFTFTGDFDDVPLDFHEEHDVRVWDDGHMTVFDNGPRHPLPRTYAKEYVIDEDNLTAELVWCYADPDTFMSWITGSHRRLDNGNRLIGWGGFGNQITATELDENDNVVWEVTLEPDTLLGGFGIPSTYRAEKVPHFAPATYPYVTAVVPQDTMVQQLEIVCNWWGHEGEVGGYEIWWGQDEDNLALHGTTMGDGFYYIIDYDVTEMYYTKIRALNADGDVISDYSPVWKVNTNPLDVEEMQVAPEMPQTITLAPAYPNPFNARTNVNILLPQPSNVELQVFDVLGRRVTELHQGRLNAGEHLFTFDARNLSSGVYFIRAFTPGNINQVQRVVLIK